MTVCRHSLRLRSGTNRWNLGGGGGGSSRRPTDGDSVCLASDYRDHGDASGGPLSPGDVGTVVEDDQSGKPFKVKFGSKSWWYKEQAIQLATGGGGGGSSTTVGARPTVGSIVYLTPDYHDHSDASGGPLTPGQPGKVTEDDLSSKPFKVKAENGKEWWYLEGALTTVKPAGAGAGAALTGRLQVGELVTVSPSYASCSDASNGPLSPGQSGKLVEDDDSSKPFKVEYAGKSWWYTEEALQRPPAAAGGGGGGGGGGGVVQVGAKVTVLADVSVCKAACQSSSAGWASSMERRCGQTATINEKTSSGNWQLKFSDGDTWAYPAAAFTVHGGGGGGDAGSATRKLGQDGRYYCGRGVGKSSYHHGPRRWCTEKYGKSQTTSSCSCDGDCGPGNGCQCPPCYIATYGGAAPQSSGGGLIQSAVQPNTSSNSYYGLFFDIKAESSSAIEVTEIHCGSESKGDTTGTLYTTQDGGSYSGKQTNSSSWKVVTSDVALKEGRATATVLSTPVRIEAGEACGFYVHGTSHNESVSYVGQSKPETWTGDTAGARVLKGNYSKSGSPFESVDDGLRQLAGGIRYRLATGAAPTKSAPSPSVCVFDASYKSSNLSLNAGRSRITDVSSSTSSTIRISPAISRGTAEVTLAINRAKDRDSLGACYYVGFVGSNYTNWTDGLNSDGSNAIGVEDDNSGGRTKMVFPSRDEINGRSFRSGDRMTLEVNFDADTLTIHRNKGRAESATLVKHGIPWSGPVYFACTLYNSNATAEILSSQIGSGGGGGASVAAAAATTPTCPSAGHLMAVSNSKKGGYAGGFLCNDCGKDSGSIGTMYRWCCSSCKDDYCFSCRPITSDGALKVFKTSADALVEQTNTSAEQVEEAEEKLAVALSREEALKSSAKEKDRELAELRATLEATTVQAAELASKLVRATEETSSMELVQQELHSNIETVMARESALQDMHKAASAKLQVAEANAATRIAPDLAVKLAAVRRARVESPAAGGGGGADGGAASNDELEPLDRVEPVLADAAQQVMLAASTPDGLQFVATDLERALAAVDMCETELDAQQAAIRNCGSADAAEALLEVRDACRIAYADSVKHFLSQYEVANMPAYHARVQRAITEFTPLAHSVPAGISRGNPFSTVGQADPAGFPEGWLVDAVAAGASLADVVARVNKVLLSWCARLGGLAGVKVAATEAAAAEVVMAMQTVGLLLADSSSTSQDGVGSLEAACAGLRAALDNERGEASDDAVIADFPAIVLDELLKHIPPAAHAAQERLEALDHAAGHHRGVLDAVLPYVAIDGKKTLLDDAKKAHSTLRECKRKVKEIKAAIEYEKDGSDDDSDAEEKIQSLQADMKAGKQALRSAGKAEESAQTALARAFRDHFPELAYTHKKVADLTRRLNFGEIPIHDSTSNYTLGAVILGGAHEVRKATIDDKEVVLKKYWLTDSGSRKVFTKEVGILTRLRYVLCTV